MSAARGRGRDGSGLFGSIPSALPRPVPKQAPKPLFGRPARSAPASSFPAASPASASPAVDIRSSAPVAAVAPASRATIRESDRAFPDHASSPAPAFAAVSPAVSRMDAVLVAMEACDLAARYGRVLPHLDEALASLFGADAWTLHLERSGSAVRGVDPDGLPVRDFSPSVARYRWSAASGLTRGATPAWRPASHPHAMAAFHGPLAPLRRPGSPAVLWGPHDGLHLVAPSRRDVDGRSPLDADLCLDPASGLAEVEAALALMDGSDPVKACAASSPGRARPCARGSVAKVVEVAEGSRFWPSTPSGATTRSGVRPGSARRVGATARPMRACRAPAACA